LEFDFRRVGAEGRVERLFAVVRDRTEQVELTAEIEKTRHENQQEMEMLREVLHVEPGTLLAFLESAKQDADAINEALRSAGKSGAENYRQRLDEIFRHSHTIKGDAELLALDFLAEAAEGLEGKIHAIRHKENLSGEDFLPLAVSCSDLLVSIERLEGVVDKWLKLSEAIRNSVGSPGGFTADSLGRMARRLAQRYGKAVELDAEGLELTRFNPRSQKALKDILVQLVRNSVYHGIEGPAERKKAGKPGTGSIRIRLEKDGAYLRLRYRDDGAGMDGGKIKMKAVRAGMVSPEAAAAMNEREGILLIFHSGFSTAENPDRVAGKGVGLSLVKERVKSLGGRITLNSRLGSHSEFILNFPLRALTGGS
jgi:chemotaxis protein histidine kinase CheA